MKTIDSIGQPLSIPLHLDHWGKTLQGILTAADIRINGTRPWDIQVNNETVFRRILQEGSLGLGESYMEGLWNAPALDQFFTRLFCAYMQGRLKFPMYLLWSALQRQLFNVQSKGRAYKNGQRHYDLGNDLYQAMLDRRMVYTCADWSDAANLDQAQEHKLDLVCRMAGLKPGMRVLDIGCGWGSFLKYAAEHYGVEAVGITVAKEQVKLGRQLCHRLPVEIRLQDYRDLNEQFDAVVSLGMFEHVGGKNYRRYMEIVTRCLKPKALFVLQTIGSNASTFMFDPWMDKYIFPGAMIPSIKQIGAAAENLLVMERWQNAGPDYDKTLMSWFENFDRHWPQLQMRYDRRFYRMWTYYLLSCAALFRARYKQLWRIVFLKP